MNIDAVDTRAAIQEFFTRYAARFNAYLQDEQLDVEEVTGAFAKCFVESSPVGVNCGQNDAGFRQVIPQGFEHYRSIGTTSMTITRLEVTSLDEYHVMAKVHWDSRYHPAGRDEIRIEFDNLYFLNLSSGEPKIFAYITGDEQKILREKGLIAG
jgi:hypothetical protein